MGKNYTRIKINKKDNQTKYKTDYKSHNDTNSTCALGFLKTSRAIAQITTVIAHKSSNMKF